MSSFHEMPLNENLIRTLMEEYKFTSPTAVQEKVCAPFLAGENILAAARLLLIFCPWIR